MSVYIAAPLLIAATLAVSVWLSIVLAPWIGTKGDGQRFGQSE